MSYEREDWYMDITVVAWIAAIIGISALALGIYQLGFTHGKAMGRRLNRIERGEELSPGLSVEVRNVVTDMENTARPE
jgi:hypothetical protein